MAVCGWSVAFKEHCLVFPEFSSFSSRWHLCARKSPYALHPVSQKFPQLCLWNDSNVRLTDEVPLSSFQRRSSSTSSLHASLLQAIDGVMSLALCPQLLPQASQHFRSSEKQATCEGCFACQSIYSVISLHSDMSRAVHILEFSKVDVDHRHIPVWASPPTRNATKMDRMACPILLVDLDWSLVNRKSRSKMATYLFCWKRQQTWELISARNTSHMNTTTKGNIHF